MNRQEEWRFFTQQLQERALEEYHATREYELRKEKQEYLDTMLLDELTEDRRPIVEDILFELISFHDQDAELLYQQGIKDGIWILKTLGMFA